MTHKRGAIHFVENNRLKNSDGATPLFVRPSNAEPVKKAHESVLQPSREEVFAKMDKESVQVRMKDLLSRYPDSQGALLEALWLVQAEFGWVPREGIRWAAAACGCSPAHAYGVATFYTMYRHAPAGRFLLQFCRNISCTVKGAPRIIDYAEKALNIKTGETTPDGLFTLLQVECLGSCGNAPVMLVNDEFATDVENGELVLKEGEGLSEESFDRILQWCYAREEKFPDGEPPRDVLGGEVAGHFGHPGAPGARACAQAENYAPPSPVLGVKAEADSSGVTLTWKGAPEFTHLVVERKEGASWVSIGEPSPKDKSFLDEKGVVGSEYRMVATSGARTAKPSAVARAEQKPEEKAV